MINNRLNGCKYCMAAQTTLSQMAGVTGDIIGALRKNTPIADAKLEALRQFAIAIKQKSRLAEPEAAQRLNGSRLLAAISSRSDPWHLSQGSVGLHKPRCTYRARRHVQCKPLRCRAAGRGRTADWQAADV
jgi:hypothetical protein